MSKSAKNGSLREHVLALIGEFLFKEKFADDGIIQNGILEAINLISDYHEEGVSLFPELIITNNMEFFKTVPNKELLIHEGVADIEEFKNTNPTAENIVILIWNKIRAKLASDLELKVTLYETPRNFVEYDGK